MSWSVLGIFILLVTWGFTKSMGLGIALLLVSCAIQVGMVYIKKHTKQLNRPSRSQSSERQKFLTSELNRLHDLRDSGLLTEDELTVQNRLLSCNRNTSAQV